MALWALLGVGLILLAWLALRNWRPSVEDYPEQGIEVAASNGPVDWMSVKADGASFAYITATSGDRGRDARFADNWANSQKAGIRRGALHHYDLCRLAHDQATNFIATVPREPDELPAVLDLDFEQSCASLPARSVLLGELASFIRMVEAHTEKPIIVRVSREFEDEYAISRAVDRPLWLTSFLLTPSYGERAWVMWRANKARSVDGVETPTGWSVVRP